MLYLKSDKIDITNICNVFLFFISQKVSALLIQLELFLKIYANLQLKGVIKQI